MYRRAGTMYTCCNAFPHSILDQDIHWLSYFEFEFSNSRYCLQTNFNKVNTIDHHIFNQESKNYSSYRLEMKFSKWLPVTLTFDLHSQLRFHEVLLTWAICVWSFIIIPQQNCMRYSKKLTFFKSRSKVKVKVMTNFQNNIIKNVFCLNYNHVNFGEKLPKL